MFWTAEITSSESSLPEPSSRAIWCREAYREKVDSQRVEGRREGGHRLQWWIAREVGLSRKQAFVSALVSQPHYTTQVRLYSP